MFGVLEYLTLLATAVCGLFGAPLLVIPIAALVLGALGIIGHRDLIAIVRATAEGRTVTSRLMLTYVWHAILAVAGSYVIGFAAKTLIPSA